MKTFDFDYAMMFWFDEVLAAPINAVNALMDFTDEVAGPFAAVLVLLFCVPFLFVGMFCTMLLTAFMFLLLVLTAPLTLPVAVWLHRRKPGNR